MADVADPADWPADAKAIRVPGVGLAATDTADHPCTRPLPEALAATRAQGRALAPGAESRLLALHADLPALRSSHGLDTWSRVCAILYALYVLGVLLGSRSAPATTRSDAAPAAS